MSVTQPFSRLRRAARRAPLPAVATALAVLAAAALGVMGALRYYRPDVILSDSQTYYLPFARRFLAEGLAFLADPRTVEVPPLSYIHPALLGADPVRVRLFNVGLYAALFPAVFRVGQLLHSRAAGILAAFGFAAFDECQRWVPTMYTEPLFVALLVVWTWAVAERAVAGRRWAVPVAGLALGLALVTRGTLLYYTAALAVVAPLLAWQGPPPQRALWRDLGLSALLALAFPTVVLVKNLLLFGYGGVYTGTGMALYLGSHPLSGGLDPAFHLGLVYDAPIVLHGLPRLSPEGDRLLQGVALRMLAERSLAELLQHWGAQLMRVLFGSTADFQLQTAWLNLRTLRIGGLVLAAFALPALRSRALAWLFGGVVAYQAAVLTPVLYLPRYSLPMDVWLIPLAAAGLARAGRGLLAGGRARRVALAVVAVAALGVVAGEWERRTDLGPSPRILDVPRTALARVPAGAPKVVRTQVAVPQKVEGIPAAVLYLVPLRQVESPRRRTEGKTPSVTSFTLTVTPPVEGRCDRARLMFRRAGGPPPEARDAAVFRIRADGRTRRYDVGTRALDVAGDGYLMLLLDCGPGTRTALGDVTVWEDRVAEVYRARYLARRGADAPSR